MDAITRFSSFMLTSEYLSRMTQTVRPFLTPLNPTARPFRPLNPNARQYIPLTNTNNEIMVTDLNQDMTATVSLPKSIPVPSIAPSTAPSIVPIDSILVSILKQNIPLPKSISVPNTSPSTAPRNRITKPKEVFYNPKQKDTLFWCFYIFKHGYSNYEMEINNRYFVVEKEEKFKYIDLIRKNKNILKIHKITGFNEMEDDLANKEKISMKTFVALCILENINVLLVNGRKIFQTELNHSDNGPTNVIHLNKQTGRYYIEIDPTDEILKKYREEFYAMKSFDESLKAVGNYKLDELMEMCRQLNLNIEQCKKRKQDFYELLLVNY